MLLLFSASSLFAQAERQLTDAQLREAIEGYWINIFESIKAVAVKAILRQGEREAETSDGIVYYLKND